MKANNFSSTVNPTLFLLNVFTFVNILKLLVKKVVFYGIHFHEKLVHVFHIVLKPVGKEIPFIKIIFQQRVFKEKVVEIGLVRETITLIKVIFKIVEYAVT
jgi:hypothetical protein